MISLFNDLSFVHDQDLIRFPDRRKTMGNNEGSPPFHQRSKGILDLQFRARIDAGSSFIQYQDGRIG